MNTSRAQSPVELQRRFERADRETVWLSPDAFPELPKNLVLELQERGCAIPQSFPAQKPQNVIRGQLARPGQFDWAVLCSRNRVSSILVFWKGAEKNPAEIAGAGPADEK